MTTPSPDLLIAMKHCALTNGEGQWRHVSTSMMHPNFNEFGCNCAEFAEEEEQDKQDQYIKAVYFSI